MDRLRGTCHCGRVAFEFDGPVDAALACNCSICHPRGALWFGVGEQGFRLLRGEDALRDYRFGTMTASHHFCSHCGVAPFCRPRIAPRAWAVNLRCADAVDLAALPVHRFDGRDWEAAARRFLERRR